VSDLRELSRVIDAGHKGESARGVGYLSRPQRREFSDFEGRFDLEGDLILIGDWK